MEIPLLPPSYRRTEKHFGVLVTFDSLKYNAYSTIDAFVKSQNFKDPGSFKAMEKADSLAIKDYNL
jgi:hypothetical protein